MANKKEYPYIGRSQNNHAKVLFISPSTGYMLCKDEDYDAGFYADDWNNCVFQPLNKHLGDNHAL